ncbi:hypothetical protein LSTR_LSTR012232 [Laodelphax striatellus]|uniref:EF-hand domain-containing protein n=1 Tax=Laodelphax striatellus TaxID=195883 RepID=A0A482WRM4_LAOST|nr:hypothetical protein LSTR_LSTR012232 [Laodelphax striatellus]
MTSRQSGKQVLPGATRCYQVPATRMRLYLWLAWSMALICGVLGAGYQGGGSSGSRGDRPRTIRGFKNGISLFPADWFADEMSKNPELAKVIVQKFIDSNQDGQLTSDELLRPLYSEK